MPNPVVHFEITGADGSALQNFYQELFDWKIDANNQWQYGVVETGGDGGINGGIAGNEDGAGWRACHGLCRGRRHAGLPRQGRAPGRHCSHAGHRDARHHAWELHEPDGVINRAMNGSLTDLRLGTAVDSNLYDATMKQRATISQDHERPHPWSGRWRIFLPVPSPSSSPTSRGVPRSGSGTAQRWRSFVLAEDLSEAQKPREPPALAAVSAPLRRP